MYIKIIKIMKFDLYFMTDTKKIYLFMEKATYKRNKKKWTSITSDEPFLNIVRNDL